MKHITAKRMKEIKSFEDLTDEEIYHTEECDYCLEGCLCGEDPEESGSKITRPPDSL
jgi:hypothetical protein